MAEGLSRAAVSKVETAGICSFSGDDIFVCRELAPGLVAHQGNVPGVVESLMDVGHLGSQEGTLDGAIHKSDEIQSDGGHHYGGQPSGNLSVTYGLP